MVIQTETKAHLELLQPGHSLQLYELAAANRQHLNPWLPWVAKMQAPDFMVNFIAGSMQRNKAGDEFAFVIFNGIEMMGRIGIYKIDHQNKTGEIGYWIGENFEGKGFVSASCKALINYFFHTLNLNRIEIKCALENDKSRSIPTRLGFTHEGIIRNGEWVYDHFTDLHLYSLLKKEWIQKQTPPS